MARRKFDEVVEEETTVTEATVEGGAPGIVRVGMGHVGSKSSIEVQTVAGGARETDLCGKDGGRADRATDSRSRIG